MAHPERFTFLGHQFVYDGAEHSTVGPTSYFYRCTQCGVTNTFAQGQAGMVPWRRFETGAYFGGQAPQPCPAQHCPTAREA